MSGYARAKIVETTVGQAPHFGQPAICAECKAVRADNRWTLSPAARKRIHERLPVTLCPACKRKRDGVPGGYLYLDGQFLLSHREEIERLLRNEAERAAVENALDRIMRFDGRDEELLTVTTTTEQMAMRLGHAVERAYGGMVRCGFSHDKEYARVWWHRD